MVLLQVLDEGSLTDSQGRKVDFKVRHPCNCIADADTTHQNTIICLTSNLGGDILANPSSCDTNGVVTDAAKSEVMERTSEYFPPELLNRLDAMLVFNKLSPNAIFDVVALRLNDVAERLKDRRITLSVGEDARAWLVKKGYSEVYGARAIARVVRSEVLFPLAQKLLQGTIRYVNYGYSSCRDGWTFIFRDGDTVYVGVTDDEEVLDIQDNHPADSEENVASRLDAAVAG